MMTRPHQFSLAVVALAVACFGATAGVSTAHAQATAPVKIAYVNSQRIFAEAPGRADAEATYEKEMAVARQQIQRMDDSLKVLGAAFDKDAPKLDSARRDARGKALQAQEEAFSKSAQELNAKMQQRQEELVRPLMDRVRQVIDDVRTQGNYSMIFDVSSQVTVVVSADKSLDVTEQVLAKLKQLGPPSATSPAPSSGPTQRPAGATRPRN